MKILVDTHAFIWLTDETTRLSAAALSALKAPENELWLSDASVWEMAIKVRLGKLTLPEPFHEKIFEAILRTGVVVLPIATRHAVAVSQLPMHHRDPFDRMLVVQASMEECAIVTHDPLIALYGVPVIW